MNSVKEINDKLSFDLDKIVGPETFEGLWENHKKVIVKRNSSPFNEAKILLKVCNLHNGIIGYFGKYNDLNHHYMVLEHYRFTLADFIIKDDHNSIKKLRENVSKVNLLQEICEGLSFLHCKNIGE